MNTLLGQARDWGFSDLSSILVPIAVLVVGFIVALLAASLVRRGLRRTQFDERLVARIAGDDRAATINTELWASRFVYYTILLITAIAFLQTIQLTAATRPLEGLLSSLVGFVPNLIAAALLAFVAWVVALVVRAALSRALARWNIDSKLERRDQPEAARPSLERAAGEPPAPVHQPPSTPAEAEAEAAAPTGAPPRRPEPVRNAVAEAGYWLVWLMFTPAILHALALQGLLVPVQQMLNKALGFLPNIASAALIVLVGWLVARIIQRLVTSVLASAGADRLSRRVGLDGALGKTALSSLLGLIVYVLVLIPVAVAALNALALESITTPASNMLQRFFAAVPSIFGAALLIGIAYVVARLLYGVIHKLLDGLGFDNVLDKIGFSQERLGKRTPSQLVAGLVMVAVLYFAAIEAARLLEFETFAALAREFAVLAGHILLGLVIFGFGLYLSRLAADAVEHSNVNQARVLGIGTRAAILVLAGAMALRQMGIADEIIELAFGLTLGAIAVAVALAFGLGGREAASKTIEELRDRLQTSAGNGGARGTAIAAESPEGASREEGEPVPPAH